MKKTVVKKLKTIILGLTLITFGWVFYKWDSPHYTTLDFLSKYITAVGIIIAVLAYYATIHKDSADESRSKSTIAFNLINQWQIQPFADYRKDIFKMEKIDPHTKSLIVQQNAGGFSTSLLTAEYAHYRSSLFCILNFFEHIAISIERGVVDEHYLKDFFQSIFIDYQSTYNFYINFERGNDPQLWIKFTTLAGVWSK